MVENLYTPGCIRTFTGKYINPINPDIDLVEIEDIAHALSHQCRFAGHLPVFYSVAQHSIAVMEIVPNPFKLCGLLHDASEAYLLDIPKPVKPHLSNYVSIEDNLMKIIAKKYNFSWPMHSEIKKADEIQLKFEWDEFMINNNKNNFLVLSPKEAKQEFLKAFFELQRACN